MTYVKALKQEAPCPAANLDPFIAGVAPALGEKFWTFLVRLVEEGALAAMPCGVLLMAGVLSRGVQWVVATVPDNFWQKVINGAS